MAFDGTKPSISQTYGDAIASAQANDADLDGRIEAHKADQNGHGLPALRTTAADYTAHKTDPHAHGVDLVAAAGTATQAEVTAGRGTQSSLAARLAAALNGDGSIKLSTLNNKWINNNDAPTFISTTSFSVPGDKTQMYIPGAQLRLTAAGNYIYAPVASRSFGAGVTTVVIDPAYPVLTAGIGVVEMALIAFDNAVAQACTQNATALAALTGVVAALKVLDIPGFRSGKPAAGAVVNSFLVTRAFTLPAGATNSLFKAGTAATAASTFYIQKSGVNVGTATFAAGSTVAPFTLAAPVAFALADVCTLVAPAAQDATLADLVYNLQGVLP